MIDKKSLLYRKMIMGIVGDANKFKASVHNSFVYNELVSWLKENNIKLDKDMFKAVLAVCKNLVDDDTLSIDKACSELNVFLIHTGTSEDGIHTSKGSVKKYVKPFYPILKSRHEELLSCGDYNMRLRQVDVVEVGRLFDFILDYFDDESVDDIVLRMDDFMLNKLI